MTKEEYKEIYKAIMEIERKLEKLKEVMDSKVVPFDPPYTVTKD